MDVSNATAAPARQVAEALVSVTGDVLRPFSISAEQLRESANVLAEPFDLCCFTTQRFIRKIGRYRGVLLKDLIEQAGLRTKATTSCPLRC